MEFELEDPLTSFQEYQSDTIGDLFASESDHMLSQSLLSSLKTSDFNVSFRFEAISYMSQVINTPDIMGSGNIISHYPLALCCKFIMLYGRSYPATWTLSSPILLSTTWTGLFQRRKCR